MTHRTSVGDLFDLSGKVTLVTGGSRGLGREWCAPSPPPEPTS